MWNIYEKVIGRISLVHFFQVLNGKGQVEQHIEVYNYIKG